MKPLPSEMIKKNIVEQLTWNGAVDSTHVNVEIEDNAVFLRGTVSSYSAKLAAEKEVLTVAPGFAIDNQLSVESQSREPVPTDNEIRENIQNALKWDSSINPLNLQVDCNNGKVNLLGTVSTLWEKFQAESIATAHKGVVDVENSLTVKPASVRSDNFIENDIKRALQRSPLIDETKIHLNVVNGVVHLSGSVVNEPIRNEIYQKALYTNGVVDVVNEITIG